MSINNVTGVRSDISEMLAKIRDISNKSQVFRTNEVSSTQSFEDVMSVAKGSLSKVNSMQAETEKLRNDYISGAGNVSMAEVAIASQKSKLAFEGLISVRNKLLEVYKDIMNMPV